VRDLDRWRAEVEPLIGSTSVYIYPHGRMPPMSDPKTAYLLKNGFRILCTVGPTPYQPDPGPGRYVLMERRHIDGMALRTQGRMLSHLFDAAAVIDPVRPKR
ncbi:MAG: glycoside hydrolase/deacetylase, partial [Firmicutes bacterium]|nr:glycoside hydrolase/deacetylase [Bacillota bacterium]